MRLEGAMLGVEVSVPNVTTSPGVERHLARHPVPSKLVLGDSYVAPF